MSGRRRPWAEAEAAMDGHQTGLLGSFVGFPNMAGAIRRGSGDWESAGPNLERGSKSLPASLQSEKM